MRCLTKLATSLVNTPECIPSCVTKSISWNERVYLSKFRLMNASGVPWRAILISTISMKQYEVAFTPLFAAPKSNLERVQECFFTACLAAACTCGTTSGLPFSVTLNWITLRVCKICEGLSRGYRCTEGLYVAGADCFYISLLHTSISSLKNRRAVPVPSRESALSLRQ